MSFSGSVSDMRKSLDDLGMNDREWEELGDEGSWYSDVLIIAEDDKVKAGELACRTHSGLQTEHEVLSQRE